MSANHNINVAHGHLRAERYAKAIAAAEKALEHNARSVEAIEIIAFAESKQGQFRKAAERLEYAATLAPPKTSLLANLGIAWRNAGVFDEALKIYETLAAQSPDSANMHYEIGYIRFRRAENRFQGVPVIDRNGAIVEGSPEQTISDLTIAKAAFERALAIQPSHAQAQMGVTLMHLGLGETYKAAIAGLEYLRMVPEDGAFAELFRDIPLRMLLEKSLRPGGPGAIAMESALFTGGTPAGQISTPTPRDPWELAAVQEIMRAIPDAISAPVAVFYHVDIDDAHPFLLQTGKTTKIKVDYLGTLAMACRCARLTQPGVKIVLLSDMDTKLDGFDSADYCIRLPRDPKHLMYARMRAYRALAVSGRLAGPVMLLDTDICLNRDFSPLFDGSFDIGFTYRSTMKIPLMPINEGLILSSGTRPGALAHFLGKCVDLYDWTVTQENVHQRYGFDVRFWRGGQLSLNAFVHWRVPPTIGDTLEANGIRCRFLHCHTYNRWVQPADAGQDFKDVWALHFKGLEPKALMADFVKRMEARS